MTEPTGTDGDVAATYCATLVDEWARLGLTDAVVSPGSRSTPLVLALAEDGRVRVHVVHDERCAGFTAVGLGAVTGRPAVVACTSGTAAVNLHPAVVEAHQAAVPVLVLTADRPPEVRGLGAPQTIDQRNLYGTSVRWYGEPGPPIATGSAGWRDLARDAWARSLGTTPGPVHLDLAFREPLLGTAAALPPVLDPRPHGAPGAAWGLPEEQLGRLVTAVAGRRGVIVAGARAARCDDDADAVLGLAEALGWPVLADHPSGCRVEHPAVVTSADQMLRDEGFATGARPEAVLRIGALHASRVLAEWSATSGAVQFGIDRYGLAPDPDRLLSLAVPADPATVCRQLTAAAPAPAPRDWTARWRAAESAARSTLDAALDRGGVVTEPTAAVEALAAVPDGGVLVVSSSMPVRDLESFAPPRRGIRVLSNRGANGIDGVTSTAAGAALSFAPTVLLTGDLAFLHDTNALLGLARRGAALTIVVVDNDGGGIFSFLPQAAALDEDRFEQLFGTPHGVDVVAVAEAHGVPAERVASRAGLRSALNGAVSRAGVRVIAVSSERRANVSVHRQLTASVAAAVAAALAAPLDPGDSRAGSDDGEGAGGIVGR